MLRFCEKEFVNLGDMETAIAEERVRMDKDIWQNCRQYFRKQFSDDAAVRGLMPITDGNGEILCYGWQDGEANRELRMIKELAQDSKALQGGISTKSGVSSVAGSEGVFSYNIETDQYGVAPADFIEPTKRRKGKYIKDGWKKRSLLVLQFGDIFFYDCFVRRIGVLEAVDAIGYANKDTLHALLCYLRHRRNRTVPMFLQADRVVITDYCDYHYCIRSSSMMWEQESAEVGRRELEILHCYRWSTLAGYQDYDLMRSVRSLTVYTDLALLCRESESRRDRWNEIFT